MSAVYRVTIACICFALLMFAILMGYRAQQPTPTTLFDPSQGTYFTAPRDLKQFHLVDTHYHEFTGKNLLHQWSIVFFGFTHCNQICPATLARLNRMLEFLQKKNTVIQVIFITLDPMHDTPPVLQNYLASFNQNIIGLSGKISEIRKLQGQLGIYANDNPTAKVGEDALIHSQAIVVINPNAKWTAKLNGDLSVEQLSNAILRIIQVK